MKHELPEGTWVAYTRNGELEYAQICTLDGEECISVGPLPPVGQTVHRCVWKKGDKLESRSTFTMTQEIIDKINAASASYSGINFMVEDVFKNLGRFQEFVDQFQQHK
jgi:hypothetical protein